MPTAPSQVFIFGSFSEDEACFFQLPPSEFSPKRQEILARQSSERNNQIPQKSLRSHKKALDIEQASSKLQPRKQETLFEKDSHHCRQLHISDSVGSVNSDHKRTPYPKGQESKRLLSNDSVDTEIENVEFKLINGNSNGSRNHKKEKERSPSRQTTDATLPYYYGEASDRSHLQHLTVSSQDNQDTASTPGSSSSLVSGEYICGDNTVDKKEDIGSGENRFDTLSQDYLTALASVDYGRSKHGMGYDGMENFNGKCEVPAKSHIIEPLEECIPMMPLTGGGWLKSLEEVENTEKRVQRRGLVNTGNLCFLNATLQALMSCTPFVHLLRTLKSRGTLQAEYPTLQAFADFSKQFEELDMEGESSTDTWLSEVKPLEIGSPFAPTMFDIILKKFTPDHPSSGPGRNRRQEDAQEFLSYTMDLMHEELLRLECREPCDCNQAGLIAASDADEDWETVGPKNRTSMIRTYTLMQSALSDIFGGQLCSIIKSKGNKASTTIQPFLLLHLDILPDEVHSVEDALKLFTAREPLENYRSSTSKVSIVSASKSLKIQALPRVLILHLMRFSYGLGGSNKLHKRVCFPVDLSISRELLASSTIAGPQGRRYELVATITHHGRDPSHGHYTADSRQPDGQWLRFDDAIVSIVGLNSVLHDQAYLLFYRQASC